MHAHNEEFLHASRVTRPRVWSGLLLNDSYKVGSLIEQGAATELYDGTEVSTGEPVALKILLPQLAEDAKTRALFLDEARALRRLSQPGLLRYRACARDSQYDLNYIVTDVVGMRMSSRLANRNLNEEDIVALTKRLALALGAAHGAAVIHRGLRPHAIVLPQGRLSEATIADFNLILSAHWAIVDQDYCAPEQSSGSGEGALVGPWTDVYSLALVILSAVDGKQSAAQRKAKPDLSPLPVNLRPIFERMLEPKPSRRLQTMDDVLKELDLALGSAPLLAALKRTQTAGLARLRRMTERETPSAKQGPDIAELLRQAKAAAPDVKPASAPAPMLKEPPPARAKPVPPIAQLLPQPEPVPAAPVVKAQPAAIATPMKLPDSRPPTVPPKPISLAKFHEVHSIGAGGYARRFAVAMSALLLAASPWIVQTTLRGGQADASTVPPPAKIETVSKAELAERAAAALPQGRVYGADNTGSRITLRFHRPTRVIVRARGGRLLFNRAIRPGDTYRAPSLAGLTLSTEDAGAVEVLFNGSLGGFAGANGARVEQAPLAQFASAAPPTAAPAVSPRSLTPAPAQQPEPAFAGPEFTVEFAPPDSASQIRPQAEAPTIEQQVGREQPAESVAAPAQRLPNVTKEVVLPPPAPVQEAPAPPAAVADVPALAEVELKAVGVSPAAQSEPRRRLIDRLIPWRANRQAELGGEQATGVILAPAITKQAADRQKAAADMARAAREAAQTKALEENRRRNAAFANSGRGISSPY